MLPKVVLFGETVDLISTFSSRGPRVDTGAPPKPNIVAPGSAIVSARDDDIYPVDGTHDVYTIHNDGPNASGSQNSSDPNDADYYVMHGTSMACPIAAGIGALILDKNPTWTPAQVRHALESTTGTASWNSTYGWGLIDAYDAVNSSLPTLESYKVGYPGDSGSQQEDIFDDFATENMVYVYSTGLLPSYNYRVVYYDGSTAMRITEDETSDASGNLSTERTFLEGTDVAGTWNVIVCNQTHTPPSTYSSTWEYTIQDDAFTVQGTAIPELPTITAAIGVAGLCFGIYYWMRRRLTGFSSKPEYAS
ncbi:S8 family serine peptidase [Chloroflexota bacterium]